LRLAVLRFTHSQLNWTARNDYEFIQNYKLLQTAFDKFHVDKVSQTPSAFSHIGLRLEHDFAIASLTCAKKSQAGAPRLGKFHVDDVGEATSASSLLLRLPCHSLMWAD
jgi:hypothetical protein